MSQKNETLIIAGAFVIKRSFRLFAETWIPISRECLLVTTMGRHSLGRSVHVA